MRLSNDLFARALDWIYVNTDIKDQKSLAAYTGITETTISRILNDRVKHPSEDTIRKLNDAFDGIFNPAYFRGENIYLLMKDAIEEKMYAQEQHTSTNSDQSSLVTSLYLHECGKWEYPVKWREWPVDG
jgi:transcriptional regulator with XRE-family HTH domain